MIHYVLIQEPRREGIYVRCSDIDQCLDVVARESKISLPGTRLTLIRKDPRQSAELLALWRVEEGRARRYRINELELEDIA